MGRMTKAILSVLLGAVVYGVWRWEFGVQTTEKEITRLIETHISLGSDKQQVIRFIDTRQWQRSAYEAPSSISRRDPSDIQYRSSGVIFAGFRNIGRIAQYGTIGLTFVFDRRGKLVGYKVQQYLEGV